MTATAPLLEATGVHASYGPIQALDGAGVSVRTGEVVALIGANGAGKTTLLACLSGALIPRAGSVRFGGEDVTGTPAHARVALGISHVPERRQIFGPLSVLDNLHLGGYSRARRGGRKSLRAQLDVVFELFPVLADRRHQTSATLSGGEQQMLALGRGLMARPQLMLLDEPSLGLAPRLARTIFATVARLPELGTAVLLVEENARMALDVAHRGYVMETGRIVLDGSSDDLKTHAGVREAYLGRAVAPRAGGTGAPADPGASADPEEGSQR